MMTGVPMPSPLPVKDGIGPTRLRVPASGPWGTPLMTSEQAPQMPSRQS